MPLYSTNRLQNMGNVKVSANESYVGSAGLGRLMLEAAQNDMAIFEAVIFNDFQEVRGIREGTLLESELQSLNEANIKGFFESLKKTLQKFWEKIKGVFKTVYAKLTQYLVHNGKAFVAMHRKELEHKDLRKFSIKDYRAPTDKLDSMRTPDSGFFADFFKNYSTARAKNVAPGETSDSYDSEFVDGILSRQLSGIADVTSQTFIKKVIDYCFKEGAELNGLSSSQLKTMMDNISTGGEYIKSLKKANKEVNQSLSKGMTTLKNEEKKLDKEKDTDQSRILGAARGYTSALQKILGIYTSGVIKAVKFGMGQDRRVLAGAVAYNPKMVKTENAEFISEAVLFEEEEIAQELGDDSVVADLDDAAKEEFGDIDDGIEAPSEED